MLKAVIFDLDDTLYNEKDFVHSGFKAVAKYLAKFGLDKRNLFQNMLELLNTNGRGRIFDDVLKRYDLYSDVNVNILLYIYRYHCPDIKLSKEAIEILKFLRNKGIKTGIITDGIAAVQKNKVKSLGLNELMDLIVYTDLLGTHCWKPSQIPFQVALNILHVLPKNAVYIGDNPQKDFEGANKAGIRTIWYNPCSLEHEFEQDVEKPSEIIENWEQVKCFFNSDV